jgi:hypothetical protein
MHSLLTGERAGRKKTNMSADIYTALTAAADAALAAFEAADEAVLVALRRGAPFAEVQALRAARDSADAALDAAIEARDAAAPST